MTKRSLVQIMGWNKRSGSWAFSSSITICGRLYHRHMSAMDVDAVKGSHDSEELPMQTIQVHGVDGTGRVLIRRQLKRRHVVAFLSEAACELLTGT